MYSKTSLMALCAAAAVKEVAAGHGHQHMHANKREVVWAATDTVVVTDYVIITVTEGQEPTVAVASDPTSIKYHPHHSHSTESSAPASTADSSTSVAEPSTSVAVPTAIPTTMITTVKPTTTKATTTTTTTPKTTAVTTPVVTPSVVQQNPTTTTSVAATSSAPVPVKGGDKRGLAFNDASLVQEFLSLGGDASWAYNWGLSSGALPDSIVYYPMLWSPAPDHSNGWDAAAKAAIAKGADALLSFNEPDIASQANMSPQDAAAAHIQWMNPYAGQARISTPAISSSENSGQGISWLQQFFSACSGQCKFDFCAAHWYGPGGADGASAFLQHLKDVNQACDGKPVWVTEFAAESGDVDAFMTNIVQALSSAEYNFVEKYSYFMASIGDLFQSPTQLSSYGKIFAGLA